MTGFARTARDGAPRGVLAPRPAVLGLLAFGQAALIAHLAYGRTVTHVQPGDHVWWHGGASHGTHGAQGGGAGLYLALAAAAVYLLLPLLAAAGAAARRLPALLRGLPGGTPRGTPPPPDAGDGLAVRLAFAVLAAVAGALAAVPVLALASAFAGGAGGGALWTGAAAEAATVLRYCLPLGVLLALCVQAPGAGRPRPSTTLTRAGRGTC
ncbi:hypothetical protein V1J52_14610 [Streptomyces sp. TRM 70351]|uniref:hypothetical protein n=1 Tax=Streptomyces sp. TRM 70351 TaxID=3116552 RepID=UPI002E7AAFAD|nr:hypothetical protein [Streptomyces sp. TRM 70351]MEE1929398.1 hypothetical protein [Streptomyces sp. TRM 70351]